MPAVAVRPETEAHAPGFDPAQISRSQLIGIEDVDLVTPVPWTTTALAAIAAFAAIVVLFLASGGTGGPAPDGLGALLSVGGTPVADEEVIELDLGEPVEITGAGGTEATLELDLLGQPVVVGSATPEDGVATIDLGAKSSILAGRIDGRVIIDSPQGQVSQPIAVQSTSPWFVSVVGIGTILVILFAFASAEAQLRLLRRGRSRTRAHAGLVVSAVAIGVALSLLVSLLGRAPVPLGAVIVVAALLAVAFLAGASVRTRLARRRLLQATAAPSPTPTLR